MTQLGVLSNVLHPEELNEGHPATAAAVFTLLQELHNRRALAHPPERSAKLSGYVLLYLNLHLSSRSRCLDLGYHGSLNDYNFWIFRSASWQSR